MLWGLMSRWMIPRLWAWPSALTIWVMKWRASRQFSLFPFFCIYCFRVIPSISSITMYSKSEERLTSYTATILGWDSMATA